MVNPHRGEHRSDYHKEFLECDHDYLGVFISYTVTPTPLLHTQEVLSTYQFLKAVAENGHHPHVDHLEVVASQILHYRVQQVEKRQLLVSRDLHGPEQNDERAPCNSGTHS